MFDSLRNLAIPASNGHGVARAAAYTNSDAKRERSRKLASRDPSRDQTGTLESRNQSHADGARRSRRNICVVVRIQVVLAVREILHIHLEAHPLGEPIIH